ncbi:hypothetical protein KI387_011544, partial [Taxus chinensis]
MHFRSHSFREHPQEKQLQEFKRNFEATQRFHHREHLHSGNKHNDLKQRSYDVGAVKNTPGKRQKIKRVESLGIHSKEGENMHLRAHSIPTIFLGQDSRAIYAQDLLRGMECKQLGGSKISSPSLPNHNHVIPLHSKPSKNSVNQLLAKVAVLEPNLENASLSGGRRRASSLSEDGDPFQQLL